MKFEYTGRHIDVTPALRAHVENHFEKIKHLFTGDNAKAHIIIEVERGRHRSEIILKWKDQMLTATSKQSDMYPSLTQTIDKIEKQVLKIKNKKTDQYQKPKLTAALPAADDELEKPEITKGKIISVKKYQVKPMTAEEAVMNLGEQENQFLVFRDAQNDRISVLYSRKDGNYGLIQP